MRFIALVLMATVFILMFVSCGSSNTLYTIKPEADLAAPLLYEKELSQLNIPISIKIKDIESQLNKSIKGLIYEDTNPDDDNVLIKIWKEGSIQLVEEAGKLKIVLPLKVWTKVRYGTTVLGMNLHDTRELNFNGTVSLLTDLTISDWQLQTKTVLKSIDWKESPSVTVAGKLVPISFLVNPALKYFKSTIEGSIDENIHKSVSIKPYVLDALEKISKPLLVNEQFQTWFNIQPLALNITAIKLQEEALMFELGLDCYMETYIGKAMSKSFRKEYITLKQVPKLTNTVRTSLMVVSPYLQASELITQNFKGQEFRSGSKIVLVQQVDLWHKNNKIIIALTLTGSINGTVYLSGYPAYNEATGEIYFEDLDYILDSKNALLKTSNWLLHGFVLKKISEQARYSIRSAIDEANKQLEYYTKNYTPAPGIKIQGNLTGINIHKIQLTDQALVVSLKSDGKIKVSIDGLQ